MTTDSRLLYSQLPATDRLLRDSAFQPLLDTYGHTRVVNTLRAMQEAARLAIRERQALPSWCDELGRGGGRAAGARFAKRAAPGL